MQQADYLRAGSDLVRDYGVRRNPAMQGTADALGPSPAQQRQQERQAFVKVRNAELEFARRVRSVARYVGEVVNEFVRADEVDLDHLDSLLRHYAQYVLQPWARMVAWRMIHDVAKRDATAWELYSRRMARELQREIQSAPIGPAIQQLMTLEVAEITSIPTKAADRIRQIVQRATEEQRKAGLTEAWQQQGGPAWRAGRILLGQERALHNIITGQRYGNMIAEIMRIGEVSRNRATLIARTETARVASTLTQVRAQHVGSQQYIWRTVKDVRVRPSHARMEGQVCRWDSPPEVEPGMFYSPGRIYNCRCFAEPIVPDHWQ